MKLCRIVFRVLLLSWVVLVATTSYAQQETVREKILVVYAPDKPQEFWKGGITFRVVDGFPGFADVGRAAIAGVDFSALLLDAYVKAFEQRYPSLQFIGDASLSAEFARSFDSIKASKDLSDGLVRERLANSMASVGASTLIVIRGENQLDHRRHTPHGALWIGASRTLTNMLTSSGEPEYDLVLEWSVAMTVYSENLQTKHFGGIGLNTSFGTNGFQIERNPRFRGKLAELKLKISDEQKGEVVTYLESAYRKGAIDSLKAFDSAMAIHYERAPYRFNLPFKPN